MTDENTNCLAGMLCPQCKSPGPFKISATALFTITDEGSDEFGDIEYDGGSYCCCPQCDHDGMVHDFEASNQTPVDDNDARAKRAADAVYQYVKAKGEAYEESSSEVVDLITDLLHLTLKLDQGDEPIDSTLRLARMHFDAEQDEAGEQS